MKQYLEPINNPKLKTMLRKYLVLYTSNPDVWRSGYLGWELERDLPLVVFSGLAECSEEFKTRKDYRKNSNKKPIARRIRENDIINFVKRPGGYEKVFYIYTTK